MSKSIRSRYCPTWPGASESGATLPAALILLACLVSVTGWLVGHVSVDLTIARTLADEQETSRLADAATQLVAMALGQAPVWSPLDETTVPLACGAPPGPVIALDAAAETLALQLAEDVGSRWGADTPRWRLIWVCHAAGVLGLWPAGTPAPSVGVWLADDLEGDGLPWVDMNHRIRVTGVSIGRAGARARATATITRSTPGAPVTLVAWRTAGPE